MIKTKNILFAGASMIVILLTLTLGSCKKESTPTIATTTYNLKVKDQLGISGTVTFTQTSATVTTIDIVVAGSDAEYHPAHIHLNSSVEGGAIALSLNPVIGGKSSTTVTALDNGSSINYSQLLDFDGYLNVHQSSSNLGIIIGQTDIGGNALTTTNKTYTLNTFASSGVSGTALFEKRKNGKALVSISLNGTLASGVHPAVIHIGSVATVGGGPTVKTLNPVDGATGKSYTNIRTLDDNTPITYDNILVYDGYLAIHESTLLMASVLCQGNIGTH
jgi:hypothetical protein